MAIAALSYHEPDIVTILVQASFLLVLNGINWALDNLIYCGLVGQILIGVAWGTPGANWLSEDVQNAVMLLGYLGLILIIYEGGLSTSFAALWSNIYLSGLVALIGIGTPIGLSFVLLKLLDASPVQAFAAGAALCSTSLGTTFTILSTSDLEKSRLGVILSSAAMLDDVAGLVMVQVISNLGTSSDSFSAITVIRPVFVSIAFAVVIPAICWALVGPITKYVLSEPTQNDKKPSRSYRWVCSPVGVFSANTLVLLGLVTGSTYAGTSNLFAAYIAGAVINWWDSLVSTTLQEGKTGAAKEKTASQKASAESTGDTPSSTLQTRETQEQHKDDLHQAAKHPKPGLHKELTGTAIYERFYAPAVTAILKPFFFASIGFSIPITQMFRGAIVWRGIVYTLMMLLGKLVCGLVLVRFTSGSSKVQVPARAVSTSVSSQQNADDTAASAEGTSHTDGANAQPQQQRKRKAPRELPKPRSLYPALMLGSAMVARGEIGFLISSLAESKGVFGSDGETSSDLFLVATWAILLCTVLGPVGVGAMVKRVRRLQKVRKGDADPLGGWGMEC